MTGLVLEGGSMRAGFVAGALMALMDRDMAFFDIGVGVSASVPTLAYFAAGQRRSMEKLWREELDSSNLVCYRNLPLSLVHPSRRWPILNIEYLFQTAVAKPVAGFCHLSGNHAARPVHYPRQGQDQPDRRPGVRQGGKTRQPAEPLSASGSNCA
jgi:hypothetical protein